MRRNKVHSKKVKSRKARKPTRAEKVQRVRHALFQAAARVVGKYGYAGASVSRITAQAGVAQGTFYNHFESRQTLLDQLLPSLGEDLLVSLRQRVSAEASEIDRERQRFEGFFEFLSQNPDFYRILNEADLFAPKAYRRHIKNMAASYLRALQRARSNDALAERFSDRELEVLVYMLLGIRNYIGIRFASRSKKGEALPKYVTNTVLKVLQNGVFKGEKGVQRSALKDDTKS